ncbi:hypothetical protein JYU34_003027 [Plutella xylostella]|uniref:Uncharacterized protein n=1 Tax=Plutella xylostella TaxID=51655 RepID=A0ABQ7QZ44_PLUXY|nr:hypothetical protein JYU34_003027 [Plutella xylostella]
MTMYILRTIAAAVSSPRQVEMKPPPTTQPVRAAAARICIQQAPSALCEHSQTHFSVQTIRL